MSANCDELWWRAAALQPLPPGAMTYLSPRPGINAPDLNIRKSAEPADRICCSFLCLCMSALLRAARRCRNPTSATFANERNVELQVFFNNINYAALRLKGVSSDDQRRRD